MADERPASDPPPGDGPYRTGPARARLRRAWIPWAVLGAIAVAIAVLVAWLAWPSSRQRPSLAQIPSGLFDDVTAWPAPEPELPPSTPLAPLLVADAPDALAVLSPAEGATRLRRGESLWVRFNRPMVAATLVGRELPSSPIVFDPPISGVARWTTRSTLSFAPAPEAFPSEPREVRLSFAPELASLSGEALVDELERVIVLDGAPRVMTYESQGRVMAGAPLPILFDAPVNVSALRSELLAYEINGGQRSLPLALAAAREQPERGFRVDVRLGRALEPGARVGIAIAPRYLSWGGSSPGVMSYELAPRPFIEGIACAEGAAYAGQCTHQASPGHVIEIGPTLRVLSSARLAGASAANVRVSPALPELSVRLAPHGPPQARLIEIEGEWESDQVYEVRLSGLRTETGEPVRAMPPIAVRSSGHAPQIRVASGRLTYERDAEPTLAFAAIHPSASDVLYRAVPAGDELRALVSPATYVRDSAESTPLAPLAPTARENRWGPGRFAWRGGEREEPMAVVAFRPDPSRNAQDQQVAFVQATDLGVTVRANADGLLVWVTRLSTAAPVRGARVSVADAQAHAVTGATTDADGVARIDLEANPLVASHAVRVVAGDDRAALLLDPRRAVIPAAMGLTPGAVASTDTIATVFTDRGAYRPGERLHAKILLRRIDGARARAVRTGRFVARLFAPSGSAPIAEEAITPSRYGTASVDLDLPRAAQLGSWRLEVARADREGGLGDAEVRVAEFRQPTFRVDLSAIAGPVHAGDSIGVDASATYLFGAPVTNGRLSWSLVRAGEASYPERWSRYTFAPVGASAGYGTVAAGEEVLGASGALHLDAEVQLATSARTTMTLEAEVTDGAGHTQAARRSFVAYPASVEVGVRRGDDWIELGAPLDVEAIAIGHEGEPIAERAIEARVVREGWHSWWEWSEGSHGARYQIRRDQRREIVHTCALTSASEPVHCAFTPPRPGTYVLEAQVRDEAGRTQLASRRVYVAGPDEQPDRDPPGAPIAVTPSRARWTVGETAELAFESPFERAEALVTVEREGVLHVERRSVGAGGQVIRIPVREDMVPNVAVGVTLVAPRTGPPGEQIDLHAPDLRFGVAPLVVQPRAIGLHVTLDVPSSARPGTEVPVAVRVTDAEGEPVAGEVALWAVDEGTLRLTGYQVPDPTSGLFRPRALAFAWDDVRRALVSRVEPPPMPMAGGDGGDSQASQRTLDDRERFDPTPLWMPALHTDTQGRASATLTLPERPTEYRVMAVALDAGARSGRASSALVAEQPLVVRPAFPRFATAGDRFEATVFVHNATEASIDARVWATVGGERRRARTLTIPAGGEVRVAEPITAPAEGPIAIRFDAEAGEEGTAVRDEVPVTPRGRFVRSTVFVAGSGTRELVVGLPEGTPRAGARASVTVAAHPFVGLDGAVDALTSSPWAGVEPAAAALLGLCAYAELGLDGPQGVPTDEVAARARERVRELLALQTADGGFGRWSSYDGTMPRETALAVHALARAAERGWLTERGALDRGKERLIELADGAAFGDWYGEAGLDENAYALRVLSELEAPRSARADALHEQRERLSPYGLAQLAMALGSEDSRSDTLVTDAVRQVLATDEDEAEDPSAIRWSEHTARVLGASLEAASRFEVARGRTAELAGALLAARGGWLDRPWGGSIESAHALSALAEYGSLWSWGEGETARASLDGTALNATSTSRAGAFFALPIEGLRGTHRLRVRGGDEGPVFFAVDGRWAVPLGQPDTVARGRRATLHRVYETASGQRIEDGASIPLGTLVRVRLFVYTEESSPEMVLLYDPIPAGFEAVDAGEETSARESLMALMGTSADDDAVDARAQHAMRSLGSIAHRAFATEAASFFFDRLPTGLAEYTYAIRATTVGEFTAPPSQIEAMYDPEYVARATVARLRVVEPE